MVNRRKQARPVKRSVADSGESLLYPVVDDFCSTSVDSSPSQLADSDQNISSKTTPSPSECSCSSTHNASNIFSCTHNFPSTSRSLSYLILPEENNNNGEHDSLSPLKCLERYVEPKETSSRNASKSVPSVNSPCYSSQRNISSSSASAPYILPTKRESEKNCKGESNALCELSQLVRKVGSVRSWACAEVHSESKCAQSVFTCLQCSRSYDTLDELVFHISTTNHFTRIATKNVEPVAPWEKGTVTTHHRDKQRPHQTRILECTLCGQTFEGDAEYHLRFKHKLDSFMDWISVIKIADAPSNPDKTTFALSKLQTLINGVKK